MSDETSTPPAARPHAEAAAQAQREAAASLERFAQAMKPLVNEVYRHMAKLVESAKNSGLLDEKGRPARRDRPAWQSPYGPPGRRH